MVEPIDLEVEKPKKQGLLERSNAARVVGNVFSMFTSAVLIRGASFILYLLVGRFLGVYEFGQTSLALTLFNTVQTIAVAWLASYITREVAKDRSLTGLYIINGSVVAVLMSGVSLVILYLFIRAMAYNPDTIRVIMWVAAGLVPFALSIISEAVYQAWEQMHFIVIVQFIGGIFKLPAIYLVLVAGYDVMAVIYVLIASHVIVLIIEWIIIAWRFETGPLIINWSQIKQMVSDARNFLGVNIVLAIRSSLSLILITKLVGETGTGLFSAAAQFVVPASLVLQSISVSLYPIMCRQFEISKEALGRISEKTFELKLIIAIPAAVGLTLLAEELLVFIYDSQEYALGANVLRIGAWGLVVQSFTHVYGKVLFAANLEKLSFQIAAIVTVVWLIFQLFFITFYGIEGAAIAVFLGNIVNLIAHYIPVSRNLFRMSITKMLWKPIVASLIMTAIIIPMRSQNVLVTILVAGIIYIISWFSIAILTSDSLDKFKDDYIRIWGS